MMFCPETLSDIEMPISYGYNACLLKSDGTGVNEAAIKQPTQVGVLCDVNPGVPMKAMSDTTPTTTTIFGGGGIVGGYSLLFSAVPNTYKMASKLSATPVGRHMGSVVVGYADGHAASVPDVNNFNVKDSLSGVVRAFYMCPALGLVDNPAAGLGGTKDNPFQNATDAAAGTITTITSKTYTVIGGDPVTRPILMAACEISKKMMKGFAYSDDGFVGSLSGSTRPSDYMEGALSATLPTYAANPTFPPIANAATPTTTTGIQIGIDAMVVVVNKNCAINVASGMASPSSMNLTKPLFKRTGGTGIWREITIENLQQIIKSDGYGVTTAGIATNHDWQVYLQGKDDGARVTIAANAPNADYIFSGATAGTGFAKATSTTLNEGGYRDGGYTGQTNYVERITGGGSNGDSDSYRGTYCANDMDIVDKVANDTLGIGIVSGAYADTKKVDILAITYPKSATVTTTVTFPSSNVRQDPGVYPPSCTWPFRRNMYAFRGDTTTASEAVSTFCFIDYKTSFIAGPLYKASFWPW
jgi:prepilin-type processing-associated H-X9-DG protein